MSGSTNGNDDGNNNNTTPSTSPSPVKLRYVALPAPLPPATNTPISITVTQTDHLPCRRCLQDAQPGDTLHLISYDPFPPGSVTPYRGAGPIFVHAPTPTPESAFPCELFHADAPALPDSQLQRLMSVRAYSAQHMLLSADVVCGSELERVAGEMLADDTVGYVYVHNAKPGCFAVGIVRA